MMLYLFCVKLVLKKTMDLSMIENAKKYIFRTNLSFCLLVDSQDSENYILKELTEGVNKQVVILDSVCNADVDYPLSNFFNLDRTCYDFKSPYMQKNIDTIIIKNSNLLRGDQIDTIQRKLSRHGRLKEIQFGGKQLIFLVNINELNPLMTNAISEHEINRLKTVYGDNTLFDARAFRNYGLLLLNDNDKLTNKWNNNVLNINKKWAGIVLSFGENLSRALKEEYLDSIGTNLLKLSVVSLIFKKYQIALNYIHFAYDILTCDCKFYNFIQKILPSLLKELKAAQDSDSEEIVSYLIGFYSTFSNSNISSEYISGLRSRFITDSQADYFKARFSENSENYEMAEYYYDKSIYHDNVRIESDMRYEAYGRYEDDYEIKKEAYEVEPSSKTLYRHGRFREEKLKTNGLYDIYRAVMIDKTSICAHTALKSNFIKRGHTLEGYADNKLVVSFNTETNDEFRKKLIDVKKSNFTDNIFNSYVECLKMNGDAFYKYKTNINTYERELYYERMYEEPEDSRSYDVYGGYNGFDDDAIDDAFEGDPMNTWNVD